MSNTPSPLDKYRALIEGGQDVLSSGAVAPEHDDPTTPPTPTPAEPQTYTAVKVHPARGGSDPRFPEAAGPIAAEQAARIVELAVKLRKHGRSFRSIAELAGVAHTTVRRWCDLEGAKPLKNPGLLQHEPGEIVRELLSLPPYSELVIASGSRTQTGSDARSADPAIAAQLAALSARVEDQNQALQDRVKVLTAVLTTALQDQKKLSARLDALEDRDA